MNTLAAVLVELGKPLELIELEIPELKPGQVLVRISYSGVCHTQLSEALGLRGKDEFLPHCLGHEGSGIVVNIGPMVNKVKVGDEVVVSWMKGSGANVPGTVYSSGIGNVNAGAATTFSQFSVISENRLTKKSELLSLIDASLLGCAIPTGIGAVINSGGAKVGDVAAIFGVGGVGLCAVAGARIAGCSKIIAIDINKKKLEVARQMGATHTIEALSQDVSLAMKSIAPEGIDLSIEATGVVGVMSQALKVVKPLKGRAVILGNAKAGEVFGIDPRELNQGKQVRGSWGGDSDPDFDFPRYSELLISGNLKVAPLVGKVYSLNDINQTLNDLKSGSVLRPIIDMSL